MPTQYRWLLLFAISLTAFLINVDYTALSLAIVPITSEFRTYLTTSELLLSSYVISWAIIIIPISKFCEIFSKKNVCLVGLALFLFGSIFGACSQSIYQLIFARIIQGTSGAIYLPTLYSMIYLYFSEQERGRAIGIMSLGIGLGLAIGPFLGGFLLHYYSWRAIFWLNVPIVSFAISVFSAVKSQEKLENKNFQFYLSSTILLGISLVLIIHLLQQWRYWFDFHFYYLTEFSIVILTMLAFIGLQVILKNPLIPLKLFENRSYLACCIGIFLEQYGFASCIIGLSFYFQKVLSYSAYQASLMFLSMTSIFGFFAAYGGVWIDRKGVKSPTLLGLILMAMSSILFSFFTVNPSLFLLNLNLILYGIGMGLAFVGLNSGLTITASKNQINLASSLFVMTSLIGNSLGIALSTLIFEYSSAKYLLTYLHNANAAFKDLPYHIWHVNSAASNYKQEIFNISTHYVFIANSLICSLAALIVLFLFKFPAPNKSQKLR